MLSSLNSFRGESMATREEAQAGIRTVDCLRGRLLAEREASKTAKAEADHIAKRLAELEKQLEEEVKQREMAEKRLKHALKKMESLKAMNFSSQMDVSDSSASSSSPKRDFLNEGRLEKCKALGKCGSPGRDLFEDDDSVNCFSDSAKQMVSQDGSWSSVGTASSWIKGEGPGGDGGSNSSLAQEYVDDNARRSRKTTAILEDNGDPTEHSSEENLALVPINIPQESSSSSCNPQGKKNVFDVLLALRHVREQLQSSIERAVGLCSSDELSGRQRASTGSMETAASK